MLDMPPTDEPLLDADQVATRLHVKRGSVYDWAARGVLPHIRILAGHRRAVIRFRREDVEEFIRQRRVGPGTSE